MLRELHISGLGVIDDLDLELHAGLNVLTGETGAGKTMVTVGLALALGARAGSSLVRDGASAARVQARFDAPDGAEEWSEDGEILLARSVNADGKSAGRVGGQLASASTLAGPLLQPANAIVSIPRIATACDFIRDSMTLNACGCDVRHGATVNRHGTRE